VRHNPEIKSIPTIIGLRRLILTSILFALSCSNLKESVRVKYGGLKLFSFLFLFSFSFLFIFLFLDLKLGISMRSHMTVTNCHTSVTSHGQTIIYHR